ncbi:hypothetical protein DW1_0277 [Proteiniborus sp. DW1]|uniref:hypothetical protein n=1 Tax=Proteiniborus sp. DW1 TaxID=1889883 RepID=UPI00092DF3FE|nr:hypothetical protein [Proteiniborus sp. DW1]SCG81897.1 hypothetical protein DW1_0277 [Proteiniborus sp. DW1]
MKNIEELVSKEIVAFLPFYIEGNSTKVITNKQNEEYIYKSIKTFITLLSKYFMVDLNSSRQYYGKIIGSTNIVPLPFNKDNIFVPLKVRKAISKNDGSFGYFNIGFIKDIIEKNKKVYVLLKKGDCIEVLQGIETAKKNLRNGYIVKQAYFKRVGVNIMEEQEIYGELNKPATKGDIVALRNELLDIKINLLKSSSSSV